MIIYIYIYDVIYDVIYMICDIYMICIYICDIYICDIYISDIYVKLPQPRLSSRRQVSASLGGEPRARYPTKRTKRELCSTAHAHVVLEHALSKSMHLSIVMILPLSLKS